MMEYIQKSNYTIDVSERGELIGKLIIGAEQGENIDYWHFYPSNGIGMSYRRCKVIMHKLEKLNARRDYG